MPPRATKPASSFDALLPLPENRSACEALSRLGEEWERKEPEASIFLFGPSGVGKSHLVHFGVQSFLKRHPQAQVQILTAAQFAAMFAESSSQKSIPLLQTVTREVDLLVVEDLQTLQGRLETQTQLLNLVIALQNRGVPLIWTANCSPGSLAGFPPRLVSRFRGGVTVRVKPLGAESRLKLLAFLARGRKLAMSEPALLLLSNRLEVSVRELMGALNRLESMSRQYRQPIHEDLVAKYLERETVAVGLTLQEIAKEVAAEFGLKPTELKSSLRTRQFAFPRQVAMWLSRQLLGESLIKVGKFYGGRDHTTVVHACQRVTEKVETDPELQSRVERIRQRLRRES